MRKTLSLFAAAGLTAALAFSGAQAQPLRPAPIGVAQDAAPVAAPVTNVQWRGPGWGGPGYGPGWGGPRYGYGYRNCGWGGCNNNNGAAVAAGVVGGMMLGAAAASAANAANSAPPPGNWAAYCASRYRSFDPASGTYLGYDGLRHPCT
ncbi:BA14K family protein [Roseixanthobacter liquoris]|uniref:BA14K family protein n=1 Tax=Roseixanthobacter liquoris TaxID=3119921 RepID=UPI00372C7D2E